MWCDVLSVYLIRNDDVDDENDDSDVVDDGDYNAAAAAAVCVCLVGWLCVFVCLTTDYQCIERLNWIS